MPGMSIQVSIDDRELRKRVNDFLRRGGDLSPAMEEAGEILLTSIDRNFEAKGRPDRWKKSKRVEKEGGETLTDTGELRRSATRGGAASHGRDWAAVGTNVPYGRIHQLGGEIKRAAREVINHYVRKKNGQVRFSQAGRAEFGMKNAIGEHVIKIPPRPYLLAQEEDIEDIGDAIAHHMLRGLA
ncbi:MAG: phage virion morphogenesis protein [Pseudomonadota bacterium]